MKLSTLLLLSIFAVSGCNKEPYWSDVCIKTVTRMELRMTHYGKDFHLMPQPVVHCVATQTQCIIPSGYDGDPVCPPIKREHIVGGSKQ